jgi:hypothetical protein
MKTLSFDIEEEQELLAILPQKYKDRINNAYSFYSTPVPKVGIDYELIDNGNSPSGIRWLK